MNRCQDMLQFGDALAAGVCCTKLLQFLAQTLRATRGDIIVAPGGSPEDDRFRPLRSGGSTSSLTNALLIRTSIAATASDGPRKKKDPRLRDVRVGVKTTDLLCAQRYHRLDPACSARRDPAGNQGDVQ